MSSWKVKKAERLPRKHRRPQAARLESGFWRLRKYICNLIHPQILEKTPEELDFGELQEAVGDGRFVLNDDDQGTGLEFTIEQPVSSGRQAGRRLVITPTTTPAAGTQVTLGLYAGTLLDFFGNSKPDTFTLTMDWPAGDQIVDDVVPPRLEQVCVENGVLEVQFSEEVDLGLAEGLILVDGQTHTWSLDVDRYTLIGTALSDGAHELSIAAGSALDLNGLGLESGLTKSFPVGGGAPSSLEVWDAGVLGSSSSSALGNLFGFHGRPADEESGLIYFRNRYSDPEMGRFISTDPLGYVDGPSIYQFAGYSAFNYGDPMGLKRGVCRAGNVDSCREPQETGKYRGISLEQSITHGKATLIRWRLQQLRREIGLREFLLEKTKDAGTWDDQDRQQWAYDYFRGKGLWQVDASHAAVAILGPGECSQDTVFCHVAWKELKTVVQIGDVTIGASLVAFDPIVAAGGSDIDIAAFRAGLVDDAAAAAARELEFGDKLDFMFNRNIDPSNPANVARARGNANRIGIADTTANRAEVMSRFNEAFNDPSSIVGPGNVPGSNMREFFLPGVTGTGSKVQFVELNGQIITIIAR